MPYKKRRTSTKGRSGRNWVYSAQGFLNKRVLFKFALGYLDALSPHSEDRIAIANLFGAATDTAFDDHSGSMPYKWGAQWAETLSRLMAAANGYSSEELPPDFTERHNESLQHDTHSERLLAVTGRSLSTMDRVGTVTGEVVDIATFGLVDPGDEGGLEDVVSDVAGAAAEKVFQYLLGAGA